MSWVVHSLFILMVFTLCGANLSGSDPEVKTPAGSFRGKTLTSLSGGEYVAFRGIPYALPPTGEHRFAKPQPYPEIKGVHDATDFGPICVQAGDGKGQGQEDCLYLNVYTPIRDEGTSEADADLKKVFVFIHGGAFILGSSNYYLPGDFVIEGDVVVVTMNYRLGWVGYMRGNSDSLPGNQAFWDQLLALQWVKDNIRAFEGDPDDVTLAGESAGSISVALLSISPPAKNLFTKGILMSGTSFTFPSLSHSSNDMIKMAASDFGCKIDDNNENIDEVVLCFQKVPAKELDITFNFNVITSLISSGDELLPRPIPEVLNDPEYLSDVGFFSRSYIVSATKDDGYIRFNSIFGQINTTATESAVQDIARLLLIPQPVANSLVIEYSKLHESLEKSLIVLCTDAIYIHRSLQFVEAFRKNSQQGRPLGTNAYLFSFDHTPEFMPNSYMVHGLDLTYIFDLVPSTFIPSFYPLEIKGDFTDEDWKMKSAFIEFVKVFMETGTPGEKLARELNTGGGEAQYISFSLHPSVGQDILGDRRKIWTDMVPKWMKEFKEKEKEKKEEKEEL